MPEPATAPTIAANGLERLPRGPHRLTREEVERSQRDRLLLGAAEAVAEKGFAATTVADILSRAGVSRTTFYQLFDDKLDCFLAANAMAADVLTATMAAEVRSLGQAGDLTALDRLDRMLSAYLGTLADNHVLARVFLVEVYAAGTEAIERRRSSLDAFVGLVADTLLGPGGIGTDERDARAVAEVLVAAVSSMVTNAVGVGDGHRLEEMHGPLMAVTARILAGADGARSPS